MQSYKVLMVFMIGLITGFSGCWFFFADQGLAGAELQQARSEIEQPMEENSELQRRRGYFQSKGLDKSRADAGSVDRATIGIASGSARGNCPVPGMPQIKSDNERLTWSYEAILSGSMPQRLQALKWLIDLAPGDAMDRLRVLAADAKADVHVVGLVAHGILQLSSDDGVLLESDLLHFYELGDRQIQKVAAMVMAQRGNNTLVDRYVVETAMDVHSSDPHVRRNALRDLGSLGEARALPYAMLALDDEDSAVQVEALQYLAEAGNQDSLPKIRPLLDHPVLSVRLHAQQTSAALEHRSVGTTKNLASKSLPGMVAEGLPVSPSEQTAR